MTTLHDICRLLTDATPLRAAIAAVVAWPADTGKRRRRRKGGPERWQAMREWVRVLRDGNGGEG